MKTELNNNEKLSTEQETPPNANVLLAVVLMHLGLFMFGSIIAAGFITIVKNYDVALKNDDWFIIAMSVSWTTYCFCKGYLEYKRSKNCR